MRPAHSTRALHVLTRLLGASALGLALVAGDAALAPAALAAPTVSTLAAAPRVTNPRPKQRLLKRTTGKRPAKKSTTARTTRRAGDVLRRTPVTRRTVARRASRPAEPVLAALPALVLPDLGSLLPGEGATGPRVAQAESATRRPFTSLGRSASALLDAMVDRARSQLGTRYVLGGASPGRSLDCSSFARYAMEALGVALPRTANQQAQVGTPVPRDRAALRPGDLLTFGTRRTVDHVGIYLGEGRFIHASVKSGRVIETTIERNGQLFRKWQGARRLIASDDTTRVNGG